MDKNTTNAPSRTAGLKPPWQPGQSGNPTGKPKGTTDSVRARLRRFLRKNAPAQAVAKLRAAGVEIDDGTVAEVLADVLALKAMGGDVQAIKEVNAQTEEPLKQTTKLEGEINSNVTLSFKIIQPEPDAEPDDTNGESTGT